MVGVVAALAAGALGNARSWAAAPEPVALLWNAPAGCPTARALHDDVESALGASLRTVTPVAAAISVIESPPGHWRASLMVHSHGQHAERQFEAESCAALAEAAALIVALAAESPGDAPAPAEEGRARRSTEDAPAPPPQRVSGWRRRDPFAQLGVLLDGGTMPDVPALGIEAAIGESWTTSVWRLRLMTGPTFLWPQNPGYIDGVVSPGQFWLLSLSARGCLTAVLARFELGPCLGGELALMRGTGLEGGSQSNTQYWASPMGSLLAALEVTRQVIVFARTEVLFPGTQRTLVGDRPPFTDAIYTIPAHAVRAAVGVELRLF